MPDYTFQALSDADFEDLVCDLLGASLEVRFQPFTKGRDSGVDLLHGARVSGSTVVQCKHYSRSKFANLKAKIVNEEIPKITKLKPNRYILATSLGLTPQNKEELLGILADCCKGVHDIYGRDDFNALLRQHPKIETTHYKLWLTSVPVLQRVLKHGLEVWNAMTKDDIEQKMSLYVQTDAYGAACDILSKYNYCVLSGIPGIGKTTLAQVLVTRLLDEGYQLIAVRDDIQEAFELLDLTTKQVVYYDDFLGQSSISERLGKNEDRGIIRLLTESQKAKRLKVIFTTREYILEDAKRTYEQLNGEIIDIAKCIVKVEDYTRGHRARILYNHVYFSGLPYAYASALLKDKSYRRIIDHKGYSPRIVEWMTLGAGPIGVQPEIYVETFVQALGNPAKVWQHAFDNQIGEDARAILYCLGTIEGWLGYDELRIVWGRLRGLSAVDVISIESKKSFLGAMKKLDGSFIRTTRVHSETAVEFHNPSIKDYVRRRIVSDADVRRELLRVALFFEQVSCLVHLSSAGQVGSIPNQMLSDDDVLYRAIERTLDAKTATYQWIRHGAADQRRLIRMDANIGERLTEVVSWSESYGSIALLSLSCRLASDMVASGDIAKAATLESCGFLEAVIKAYPGGEYSTNIISPFLMQIRKHLSDIPSATDWSQWTDFVRENESLFKEEEMDEWAQQAWLFCTKEIDEIIGNAESSSQAQEWYDEVASVAERWQVSLTSQQRKYDKYLDELYLREEGPDRDDENWRGSQSSGGMTGNDAEVDRLFESLTDTSDP